MNTYTQIISNLAFYIRKIDKLPPEKFITSTYVGKHLGLSPETMHNYRVKEFISTVKIDAFCEQHDIDKDDIYHKVFNNFCVTCGKELTIYTMRAYRRNNKSLIGNECYSCHDYLHTDKVPIDKTCKCGVKLNVDNAKKRCNGRYISFYSDCLKCINVAILNKDDVVKVQSVPKPKPKVKIEKVEPIIVAPVVVKKSAKQTMKEIFSEQKRREKQTKTTSNDDKLRAKFIKEYKANIK